MKGCDICKAKDRDMKSGWGKNLCNPCLMEYAGIFHGIISEERKKQDAYEAQKKRSSPTMPSLNDVIYRPSYSELLRSDDPKILIDSDLRELHRLQKEYNRRKNNEIS